MKVQKIQKRFAELEEQFKSQEFYPQVIDLALIWVENYFEKSANDPEYLVKHFLHEFEKRKWDRVFSYVFVGIAWTLYADKDLLGHDKDNEIDSDMDQIYHRIDGDYAQSAILRFPGDPVDENEFVGYVRNFEWLWAQ